MLLIDATPLPPSMLICGTGTPLPLLILLMLPLPCFYGCRYVDAYFAMLVHAVYAIFRDADATDISLRHFRSATLPPLIFFFFRRLLRHFADMLRCCHC